LTGIPVGDIHCALAKLARSVWQSIGVVAISMRRENSLMDDELWTKIGLVAGKLVQQAIENGLNWDEAVAAFGLAAKASAQAAASAADGSDEDCVEFARRRLEEAFNQDVRVTVTEAGSTEHRAEVEDNPLLATARRRQTARFH
jgi:hypothetical protein